MKTTIVSVNLCFLTNIRHLLDSNDETGVKWSFGLTERLIDRINELDGGQIKKAADTPLALFTMKGSAQTSLLSKIKRQEFPDMMPAPSRPTGFFVSSAAMVFATALRELAQESPRLAALQLGVSPSLVEEAANVSLEKWLSLATDPSLQFQPTDLLAVALTPRIDSVTCLRGILKTVCSRPAEAEPAIA